jgi:hypothetical protein
MESRQTGQFLEWKLEACDDLSGCWLWSYIDENLSLEITTDSKKFNYVVRLLLEDDLFEVGADSLDEAYVLAEDLLTGYIRFESDRIAAALPYVEINITEKGAV